MAEKLVLLLLLVANATSRPQEVEIQDDQEKFINYPKPKPSIGFSAHFAKMSCYCAKLPIRSYTVQHLQYDNVFYWRRRKTLVSRIHAAKIHSATGQETVKRYISTKMARLLKYFWTSLIHSLTCAYCLSNKNFTQCVYHHQKSHLTHFQQWRNNRLRMRFWLRHPWVNAVIAVMKMIINLVNQERRRLLLYFPGEAIPLTAVFFLRHQYRQKEESQPLELW